MGTAQCESALLRGARGKAIAWMRVHCSYYFGAPTVSHTALREEGASSEAQKLDATLAMV